GIAPAFSGNLGGADFWPRGGALCSSFLDWCGGHPPGWIELDSAQMGANAPPPSGRLWGRCAGGDRMIPTAPFLCAGPVLAGSAVLAQSTVPESADSRYTFNRIDDGYLRLDGRTGQVSICARRPVGWTCEAVPDERAALEAEIARLQGENIAVKKELLARN